MRKSFFAVFFLAICSLLAAQQALNNDAVIKLAKAGLSDDVIISTINASPGTYDTSANGLVALKQAGVSDKVIGAIVVKSAGGTPPPSQPAPESALYSNASYKPSITYKQGEQWIDIDYEKVALKSGGVLKTFATGGMRMADLNGHLPGKTSKLALKAPATFRVLLPSGTRIGDCQLIKLHVNKDNREFRSSSGGYMHVSTEESSKDSIPFDPKQIGPQLYEVTLASGTAPGEYGFLFSDSLEIYSFSLTE